MSLLQAAAVPVIGVRKPSRFAYADNLKVLLVVGVIVGHVTMAYSDVDAWVLEAPPVRDPLLSVVMLAALVGAMFAMALFFLVAGAFTPPSLARKGLRRFLADRTIRLGVPMVVFIVAFAPIVEYVDTDWAGWDKGFPAFAVEIWQDPSPGPTWFLGVLLLFSAGYAVVRTLFPRRTTTPAPIRGRHLVAATVFIAVASYAIRLVLPLGEEWTHLALGQAPSWVTGFALGVLGAERGWFDRISPALSHRLFQVAWGATAGVVVFVSAAGMSGADVDLLFGGGTWQSLLVVLFEAPVVVAMSLWLFDAFQRRVNHQGSFMRQMSRAAFAAFLVHQVVAVGAVLAMRHVAMPPEVEYVAAATLAVVASFGLGALLARVPGIARIV